MLGSPLQTPEGELGVAFPPEDLPKAGVAPGLLHTPGDNESLLASNMI